MKCILSASKMKKGNLELYGVKAKQLFPGMQQVQVLLLPKRKTTSDAEKEENYRKLSRISVLEN